MDLMKGLNKYVYFDCFLFRNESVFYINVLDDDDIDFVLFEEFE